MTIGLTKEEIIAELKENKDIISEELFEKIADVIVANNIKIQQQVTEVVSSELLKELQRTQRTY